MNLVDKNCYQCKAGLLPGHNYTAMAKIARKIFNTVVAKPNDDLIYAPPILAVRKFFWITFGLIF